MDNHSETPEISIDEALELFIAVSYPQGIPEDIDKDELYKALKAKIAQDRPEWAAKNVDTGKDKAPPSPTGNYKEIKEAIIAKSNESEIPEDPEERYLYERKQKALRNLEAKKVEEKENAHREALRQKIIEKNKNENVDEDFLNKTLRIKQELQKKLSFLQNPIALDADEIEKPEFSERKDTEVSFTEDAKVPDSFDSEFSNELPFDDELDTKPNNVELIKSIESLDREERIKAMVEYNQTRRASMQTKESVLRADPKEDDRFSMEIGQKKEIEKLDQGDKFLNYLKERRRRKPGDMENKLEAVKPKEKNSEKASTKITDDMSMEGSKKQSGKLNVNYSNQSGKLILD